MGGIRGREKAAFLGLAVEEDTFVRHEHIVEDDDAGGLSVLRGELGCRLSRTTGRPRHDGHSRRVHWDGAANSERSVLRHVGPAGHDKKLMHVRRAGNDGLCASDNDAVSPALLDVHVYVGVGLLAGALRAITLDIRHRDTECQVAILHVVQIGEETLMVVGAMIAVDALGRLEDAIERIVGEISLRTARHFAHQSDRLELIEEVSRGFVYVEHAVDSLSARALVRRH
jgi:hypothetical protein